MSNGISAGGIATKRNPEYYKATETFTSCNIIQVKVLTTGPRGGDCGHGCWTEVSLTNEASTVWEVDAFVDGKCVAEVEQPDTIRIIVRGDTELETLAQALKFAGEQLQRFQTEHPYVYPGQEEPVIGYA